jgi:hypothetical protein
VDGADPRPGDAAKGLLHSLLLCGTDFGMPGRTTPGYVIPTPESSGVAGPGKIGLFLQGSTSSPSAPIDWGQVEDNAEFTCSQVTIMERLL